MLNEIKILGDYIRRNEKLDKVDILVENSKLSKAKNVICLNFTERDGIYEYLEATPEKIKKNKKTAYLYATRQDGNFDASLTSKLKIVKNNTQVTAEKSYQCCLKWLNAHKQYQNLELFHKEFDKSENKIKEDILKTYKDIRLEKNEQPILTVKINNKYLGEIDYFKNIFEQEVSQSFYFKKDSGESKGKGICRICGNMGEVYGYALPFSFYTLNKQGFAPNFIQNESWKRLPLCPNCALSIRAGKEFLEVYLNKSFYRGYKFYVIPSFLKDKIIDNFIVEVKRSQQEKEYSKGIISIESDEIIELLGKGSFSLIYLFYSKDQKNIKIVNYIEDVPPSWLKKIAAEVKKASQFEIFQEESLKKIKMQGKDKSGNLSSVSNITLGGLINDFFPNSKINGIFDKYFIDIIGDILRGRQINEDFLINAFLREIKNKFVNEKWYEEKLYILKSLMLLLVLRELKLIKNNTMNETYIAKQEKNPRENACPLEDFFNDYKKVFNDNGKKAAFAVGCLAGMLLTIQGGRGLSHPFRNKLHNLDIDEKRLKKIYVEAGKKLDEYKLSYRDFRENIGQILLNAENYGWQISKDEISYYFSLGFNLEKLISKKINKESVIEK
jgi:CRISPR-associated protein Csh1